MLLEPVHIVRRLVCLTGKVPDDEDEVKGKPTVGKTKKCLT